jgi:DNA processing protein
VGQTTLDDETRALLTLSFVRGMGATKLGKLLEQFDSAVKCLAADDASLRRAGLSSRLVVAVMQAREDGIPEDEEARLLAPDLSFVRKGDDAYPVLLKHIYDPPPLLYVKGALLREEPTIAIVGSRWADAAALRRTREIAEGMAAEGFTVISGLAEGVDTQAHQGALEGGGRTIAVLANGLATVYPALNTELAESIKGQGAVVSERRLDAAPRARNFPSRNRIISGMCRATLVVQAPKRSGALITAHRALEEGREVFAMPWDDGEAADGSNLLIADGATAVSSAEELADAVRALPALLSASVRPLRSRPAPTAGPDGEPPPQPPPDLRDDEAAVWAALSEEATHIDALVQLTGMPAGSVGGVLLLLEMKSLVRQYPGKRFARKG